MNSFLEEMLVSIGLFLCSVCAYLVIVSDFPWFIDLLVLMFYTLVWAAIVVYIWVRIEDDI